MATRPLPSAVRHEPLGDDGLQRAREHRAGLLLLVRREEVDDAVDRLGGVDGVERREHEVAGLGRGQRGADRLLVAHLADQDHVRVLAQHAAQRAAKEAVSSPTSRWLMMRALVAVEELDRVLDRDDVLRVVRLMWSIIAASVVDLPEPVVPVSRMMPALLVGELVDHLGQAELLDGLDLERDRAQTSEIDAALHGRR